MTFALPAKVTSTEVAVLPALPSTVTDDKPLMTFAELASRDKALAQRLQGVAQTLIKNGTRGSLDGIESVMRSTLAAAAPEDSTRFFSLVARTEASDARDLVVRQTTGEIANAGKAIGTTVLDAALFPYVSPAITAGVSFALCAGGSPWLMAAGAGATLLHAVASCTYFTKVKGWDLKSWL